ncbi:uncharacterized protein LOC114349462 [Diabrotica virgifera virgifera]|uniref:Fibronectin type-III domain-containing protein n=1 Tax=Diabrotica virgifera virgifera TaxID=50390 RepID=A0ABM5KJ35_DIAVI|nr:uncharacterized protein LOC114349462 [Diabrotica virgifera virgifera]
MSYNKLIQHKRSKMLYLALLLVFYPFLCVTGINLTYIVKKDGNFSYPSCIAEDLERYTGVGWVYPIPSSAQNLPSVATKFIPTLDNEFNCQFTQNSPCNLLWSLRDWQIDNDSPKTKEVIFDRRWEDLPTIFVSNTSKEFEEKVDLRNILKQAFSVRADGLVEIFICSGSDPNTNPCYYFYIESIDIYFKYYAAIPKDVKEDVKKKNLQHVKATSSVLSPNEWRNFIINYEGSNLVQLIDVTANLKRVLIEYFFDEPMTAAYMFMRSSNSSLWKMHHNSFMFTNTTQISRLGPILTIPSKDLCVSLLVKVCSYCEIKFLYLNKTRRVLKVVGPPQNEEWVEVKLKEENIQFDKLNLFVETKYVDGSSKISDGFWAIDDVRVCNENEVKVSYLKLSDTSHISDDNITCQLVKNPSWRPKKVVYTGVKDFPEVFAKSTKNSIQLKWIPEDKKNPITYFIFYQGNDICTSEPHNEKRYKSSGFISTKLNDVTISDLVPYTYYNITISTVLHETDKKLVINTLETDEPSLEELPTNIKLKPSYTSINVTWEPVNCHKKYGRLVYTVIVSNSTLNFTKEISLQTNTSYEITGLKPYSHYSLTILTARNGRSIYRKVKTTNYTLSFTTLAGIAPSPENLEIYSIDQNTASLRYDLPTNSNGIIKDVHVSRCNSLSFSKCKASFSIVKRCSLWPKKYCVEVNYLIPFQSYNFRVALKNLDTPTFGKEAVVKGFASDKVPGQPTNITYKMVNCRSDYEYCDLNISWLHPYHQNGTITQFEIVLNSTNIKKEAEDDKYIHEVYTVLNKTYYYDYTYQIKDVPYDSHYNLYIRSGNTAYKSDYAETHVKTDHLGDHIDQSPKLLARSDNNLLFKMPYLDSRLQSYTMTVVVQDYDKKRQVDGEVLKNKKVADNLCNNFGDTWIAQVMKVDSNDSTRNIAIGNAEKQSLKPNTKYCITFIITNRYKDAEHDVVYYEKLKTTNIQGSSKGVVEGGSSNHLYMLFLILLIIPVGFLVYRYFRKKRYITKSMITPNDHCYETLPCNEIRHDKSESNEKLQPVVNRDYS